MIEVALVRHGETDWNRQGRMQGHRDIPLNERGMAQAMRLARRLRHIGWDLVASSDLQRAVMTADCLAEAAGVTRIVRDPRLRERHFGRLEGTTRAERLARWGTRWQLLDHGAESDEQLVARTQAFLADLTLYGTGRFIVVTHGGWIRTFMRRYFPERAGIHPGNTSLSMLQWADGQWRCLSYNDTGHLAPDA